MGFPCRAERKRVDQLRHNDVDAWRDLDDLNQGVLTNLGPTAMFWGTMKVIMTIGMEKWILSNQLDSASILPHWMFPMSF